MSASWLPFIMCIQKNEIRSWLFVERKAVFIKEVPLIDVRRLEEENE